MNIKIRKELPSDYRDTENIAREAFYNLYFPGCEEHYLIHKMRNHSDYLTELSAVIEVDGEIAGSIFYTKSYILQENGVKVETVTFGPVCIDPKYHRQGLGRQMIEASIVNAKEMGYKAILTLGYAHHYTPYGFVGGKKYGVAMGDGKFYKGLLVLPLYEGALDGVEGKAVFSDVFELDQDKVEAFDLTFPKKEKKVLPCQAEYEVACMELDEEYL